MKSRRVREMLCNILKIFIILCVLQFVLPALAVAEVSNRAATTFSLRDVIAQFMIPAVADETTQLAQQQKVAAVIERFKNTYSVDPAQSLYHVLKNNPDVQKLRLFVDNTVGETDLRAMNFEIMRMDFEYLNTSYSIFILLTRAGAQHVEPEAFVGIERIVLSKNGTSLTTTGMNVAGILAALYKNAPS